MDVDLFLREAKAINQRDGEKASKYKTVMKDEWKLKI